MSSTAYQMTDLTSESVTSQNWLLDRFIGKRHTKHRQMPSTMIHIRISCYHRQRLTSDILKQRHPTIADSVFHPKSKCHTLSRTSEALRMLYSTDTHRQGTNALPPSQWAWIQQSQPQKPFQRFLARLSQVTKAHLTSNRQRNLPNKVNSKILQNLLF